MIFLKWCGDGRLGSLLERNEFAPFRSDVVGGRSDDLVVGSLFDHVGGPSRGARDHEERREHRHRHPEQVVGDGAEPVEVGEHLLGFGHDALDPLRDLEHAGCTGLLAEVEGGLLDHLVSGISDRIDRVPEADDHLFRLNATTNIAFCLIRVGIAPLNLEGDLVGTSVFGTSQRTDGTSDRRVHVGARPRDGARGERGRIEFVLGVQDERRIHRADVAVGCRRSVKQAQNMACDCLVVRFDVDAATVKRIVIPVEQHRTERSQQPVGDFPGGTWAVIGRFRKRASEGGDAASQNIHRMCRSGQCLERCAHRYRKSAPALQASPVGRELAGSGQLAMHEEMRDFLEFAALRDIEYVVAAIVEVVSGAANRAQCGVACDDAGQSH